MSKKIILMSLSILIVLLLLGVFIFLKLNSIKMTGEVIEDLEKGVNYTAKCSGQINYSADWHTSRCNFSACGNNTYVTCDKKVNIFGVKKFREVCQRKDTYWTACSKNPLCKVGYTEVKRTKCNNTHSTNNTANTTYVCSEEEKSGLCGPSNIIFPLDIQREGDRIYASGPGTIFEDENFKIYLETPEYLVAHQEYALRLSVENKKGISSTFKYSYLSCVGSCQRVYENVTVDNFANAVFTVSGKDTFYTVQFLPLEKKIFPITFTPIKPTLTRAPNDLNYLTFYYYQNSLQYVIDFQSWIKLGAETLLKDGQTTIVQPALTTCGNYSFPSTIEGLDGIGEGRGTSYGYYSSKCINNIFYPNFECSNNQDCSYRDNTDGYCVDGFCMPIEKPQNRLVGTKKILVASDFNEDDSCSIVNSESINPFIISDIGTMEEYYDHEAGILLNKSDNFVNFEISLVLKLPSSFIGFHPMSGESEIINKLNSMCGINASNFDVIILPRDVTSIGGAAGFAFGIGNSKVVLAFFPNAATLIHEVGHLFGCTDLYQLSGGRMQWAHTLYGEMRTDNVNFGPVNLIELGRIGEIQKKAFQVCRGHIGWTDNNQNGVIDVEESQAITQIKINYTSIRDEERPKGRYIIFENLSVSALTDSHWRPFSNAQKSIIIERNGIEEYTCGGTETGASTVSATGAIETCAPVLETDVLILRAEYSYINTTLGTTIKLTDEIRLLVSDLVI